MARFTLNTTLTLDHHAAHVNPIVERTLDRHYGLTSALMGTWASWLTVLVVFGLCAHRGLEIVQEWQAYGNLYMWTGDWVLLAMFGVLLLLLIRDRGRPTSTFKRTVNKLVSFDGVNVGPMTVIADEDSLTVEHTKRKTTYKWAAFEALGETGEALALQMSKVMVVLLPFSAFKDEAERKAFEAFARAKIETSVPR
ncbi:MAG: YcxB family protein [Alphaproteobacteria bacterium]|nr:YcxB family protein [Alphaproteobacteria bacterium]